MSKRAVFLAAAVCVGTTVGVSAKEQAGFIKGIFATAKGCEQLEALANGKAERSIKTVPEVLSKDGIDGWEFACEFTKIHQHNQSTWIGLMLCQEGNRIAVSNTVFSKLEDGSFEVFTPGEEQPDLFQLCAVERVNDASADAQKASPKPAASDAANKASKTAPQKSDNK